jgi:predicted lipid-binding transport protein (Tim44 family)
MIALATGNLMLAVLAMFGFSTCWSMRQQLLAAGPYGLEEETSYAAAYEPQTPKRKPPSRWAVRRAEKQQRQERDEQASIDAILAKVSAQGMNSLSRGERKTLARATERQRQADLDRARRAR